MPRLTPHDLTTPGRFVVGCNYWASHAGTRMWADWRPDIVDRDLAALAASGLHALRVFPLWPDFQPLTLLRGGGGHPVEFRHGETPLPDDAAGRAGVSPVAMAHFGEFLDLADRHGLGLLVGLLTGWMSGRLFVPPALEGLNVLTDPVALQWELRLVRHLVAAAPVSSRSGPTTAMACSGGALTTKTTWSMPPTTGAPWSANSACSATTARPSPS